MMDTETVRGALVRDWPGAELRALTSVSSTSDIAWAWADAGCAEGTTVLAEEQVMGRGRFGRRWHSPRGRGILMSLVLRPMADAVGPAHLVACAALAVAQAIETHTGLTPQIRWPNDVTLGRRKVAGVLAECRGEGANPCVVGIGLNVNTRPDEFPQELRLSATSLAIAAGEELARDALAADVLHHLALRYRETLEGRWAVVAAAWRSRASLLGEAVTVQAEDTEYRGMLVDSDPLDGITIELPGGVRRAFRAEQATLALLGN